MSITQAYKCDGCGAVINSLHEAFRFAGGWQGNAAVSAGMSQWHACSASCAAKHIRSVADALDSQTSAQAKAEK